MIAGNPPWIAYRYLQDESYRNDVKTLTREYGLLGEGEMKLHTQIELSTLFYEHCARVYLKSGGTLAFVMPRSVLTGAKQHRAFQQKGFARILDLEGVAPLFNVPTCVLIREAGKPALTTAIPTAVYDGRVPTQECSWGDARQALTRRDEERDFAADSEIASSYYYPRVINGATLYPRNLVFVTSAQPNLREGETANNKIMRTDPDVFAEAKEPWKSLPPLQGYVDDDFLYATLLSKNLVPFGVRRLHLVALPVRVGYPNQIKAAEQPEPERRFIPMSLEAMRESVEYGRSADWFAKAERVWAENKRDTTKESLAEWLNYQNKIVQQSAEPGYRVLYNASGSSLAAALVETGSLPVINGVRPANLVVDHTTYWYHCATPAEGHYLVALLNAPCVNFAIKSHQTRGMFGARHVHRRPFEVCAIQEFDTQNADHQRLTALSQAAHATVAALDLHAGGVVAARKQAREAARELLREIDAIAQRLLGLAAAPAQASVEDETEEDAEATLAE